MSSLGDSEDIIVIGEAGMGSSAGTPRPVDIVIMDIDMPEMDGIQATREVNFKFHLKLRLMNNQV